MGWSTTVIVPPDGNMDDYLLSLKKLLSRNEDRFFPTHGPIIDNPKKLVNDYISHRLNREKQIIDAIKKGNNKISDIVKMIYKDVDKSLHPCSSNVDSCSFKKNGKQSRSYCSRKGVRRYL